LRTYAGLNLIGLKEAGGWESLSSVERYAHVIPNESAKAVVCPVNLRFPYFYEYQLSRKSPLSIPGLGNVDVHGFVRGDL
jgi:hypothetical protein